MVLLALQFVAFQPAVQEILENYNTGKWLFCVKYLLKTYFMQNECLCDPIDLRCSLGSVIEPEVAAWC